MKFCYCARCNARRKEEFDAIIKANKLEPPDLVVASQQEQAIALAERMKRRWKE